MRSETASRQYRIIIGGTAGHHFHGQADLQVAHHATRTSLAGIVTTGFRHTRKRLIDRKAYEYDPQLGWGIARQMCNSLDESTNVVGYVKGNGREWIPILDENAFGDIPEEEV